MSRIPALLAALALAALGANAHAAEVPGGGAQRTLVPGAASGSPAASADLEVSGTFVRTGEKSAAFAGDFRGTFRLKDASAPTAALDGAALLCVATLLIDLPTRFQDGEGHCTLTAKSGDLVFAVWECGGDSDKGCNGSFEIQGGTGALKGIDGGSDLLLRSGVESIAQDSLGKRVDGVKGGAEWKKLVLSPP
jgi:hypothetical protein